MPAFAAAATIALLGSAPDNARAQAADRAPVIIPGSETRTITSRLVPGQKYLLQIHLPAGYASSDQRYPVLFVLDSQWDFPLVTAIYGQQYYDGFLPAAVIVGVTWGGVNPDADALRGRDFTPTPQARIAHSGNAPQFLAFLRDEAIPFVEANYRVLPDRTLMGSSLGGLFTLYALLEAPGVFNRFVLTSPAAGWDSDWIYHREQSFSAGTRWLPARLFMAAGGLEPDVADFERLAAQLHSRAYQGLELQSLVIEGSGHSGGKAEGFTRGLQSVFARPSLALSPDVLARYVGEYATTSGERFVVSAGNGRLQLTEPGGTRTSLLASSDSSFYANGQLLNVRFSRGGDGRVRSVHVERYAGTREAHR